MDPGELCCFSCVDSASDIGAGIEGIRANLNELRNQFHIFTTENMDRTVRGFFPHSPDCALYILRIFGSRYHAPDGDPFKSCVRIDLGAISRRRLIPALERSKGYTQDQKWVAENAETAQDTDAFMAKCREYDDRYRELQSKVEVIEEEKRVRQGRVKRFELFLQTLKKQHGEPTEFDESAWLAVIDTVLVKPDGKLVFRFANGMEVKK